MPEPQVATPQTTGTEPVTGSNAVFDDSINSSGVEETESSAYDEVFGGDDDVTSATPETEEAVDTSGSTDEREQKLLELAKKWGVNVTDPAVRKLLEANLTLEKKVDDRGAYIDKLRDGKLDEFLAGIDKALDPAKPESVVEQQQPIQQQQFQQPNNAEMPMQDIGTTWKNPDGTVGWRTQQDAIRALSDAYQSGDVGLIAQVEQAKHQRDFNAIIMPRLMPEIIGLVEGALSNFKKREKIDEVVPTVLQERSRRESEAVHAHVTSVFSNDANFGPTFKEMMRVDGAETITYRNPDGSVEKLPNSPFNQIMAEFPEMLERIDWSSPRQELQRSISNVFKFALKQYVKQKQQGLTPEKAQELIKTGVQQQERTIETKKVRAAINAGSSRQGGATSTGDNWINDVVASRNTTSLASRFRNR